MPRQLYKTRPLRDSKDARDYLLDNLRESSEGWIYVIRMNMQSSAVKIGWAVDPMKRMTTLQTGNPVELELVSIVPGAVVAEKAIHKRLSHSRVRGEWFIGSDAWAVVEALNAYSMKVADASMCGKPIVPLPTPTDGVPIGEEPPPRAPSTDPTYLAQLADMTPRTDPEEAQKWRSQFQGGGWIAIDSITEPKIHSPNPYHNPGKGRKTSAVREVDEMRVDGKLPLYIRRKAA